MDEVFKSIDVFLKDLEKKTDKVASQFIRNETGPCILRNEMNTIALSPHLTYCQIYESWVWSRGWKIVWEHKGKGQYAQVEKWEDRPFSDEWPVGLVKKEIFCRTTFLARWSLNHSHIKIRPRAADTCTTCWGLAQEFRSQGAKFTGEEGQEIIENESDEFIESMVENFGKCLNVCNDHIRI